MVVIIRDGLLISLLILEAKFADDSLSYFGRFKQIVPWLPKEINEIGKGWLKDGIFAITNIGVEISKYLFPWKQVFLDGIQGSSLIIKTNKHSKKGIWIKLKKIW